MTNKDIINMYHNGFSIAHIAKCYYRYKTKFDVQNHKYGDTFIVTKKSCTINQARKYVEKIIFEFAFSNKAN